MFIVDDDPCCHGNPCILFRVNCVCTLGADLLIFTLSDCIYEIFITICIAWEFCIVVPGLDAFVQRIAIIVEMMVKETLDALVSILID